MSWKRENRSIIVNDQLKLNVNYESSSNATISQTAVVLDTQIMPLITSAPNLLESAKLALEVLDSHKHYNDIERENAIAVLKFAIQKAT